MNNQFLPNPKFHGKRVTVYMSTGVKLQGTLKIEGDVWLTTKSGSDVQQLNPALISTIAEIDSFEGDTWSNR